MDLMEMSSFDASMIAAIQDMIDFTEDTEKPHPPSRAYVRDNKAMKATPADIVEYPNAYHYVVDMPGIEPDQIKVHVEDCNVLVVTGERRREKDKDVVKYVRMERRLGKFLKKFVLSENANTDSISAVYQDGVLTVIVEKLPPPEPKKPKTIEVKVCSHEAQGHEVKTGSQEAQAPEVKTGSQEAQAPEVKTDQ